jgi:hypothetical protein
MRIRSAIVLVACGAAVAASPAGAHTFSGSCAMLGTARTVHPLTPILLAPDSVTLRSSGTCTGTLDGRQLPTAGTPVALTSTASLAGGDDCFLGALVDTPFRLSFTKVNGGRAALQGIGSFVDGGPVMPGILRGVSGGLASGFDYIAGGAETVQACLAGELQSLTVSTELYTVVPLAG